MNATYCLMSAAAFVLYGTTAIGSEPSVSAKPTGLETSASAFVGSLAKGDFADAVKQFDKAMTDALPENRLRAVWDDTTRKQGALRRQQGMRTEKLAGYDVVYVACEFEKGVLDVKVVFDRNGQIAGLFFVPHPSEQPPAYVKPASYVESETTIGNSPWQLPATLTLPTGRGPFSAIVLVHGSGPNDRDETIGSNKPFRDLAWGLASQGVAVLRYEKRTKHCQPFPPAALEKLTVQEETIDDCLAAVSLLRQRKEINAQRVYVLGHSLGGMLVPRIGAQDANIAGFVILAGNNRPIQDLFLEQSAYSARVAGLGPEETKQKLAPARQEVTKIENLRPGEASTGLILGAPAPYWLDLRGYVPAKAAKDLKRRLLILQGERDYQVTMEDFRGWKEALAGRPNVSFQSYPKLNHLFIEGEGQSTPAEYEQPGHVAGEVIHDIGQWIRQSP